ncbi:hypothetical protein BZG36_05509 [Bifiguratus adelaidae]|uniref:Uncharacterized protein n=1 Tax=Bifiguratus adelaidae TaxID=1938954 RepID=A0A261XT57_9FUNG|nr:hypothetical protein BZG36_05509 [Bifiguratus adelaidae]
MAPPNFTERAAITKRWVEQHGFNMIAVEADWPDAAAIDRFVRLKANVDPIKTGKPFTRFPTCMWANEEVHRFFTPPNPPPPTEEEKTKDFYRHHREVTDGQLETICNERAVGQTHTKIHPYIAY